MKTATIRDLRNAFPRVRRILEEEGELVLTSGGRPLYKLVPYVPPAGAPASFDYWGRLVGSQPKALSKAQSRELHDENRGDR